MDDPYLQRLNDMRDDNSPPNNYGDENLDPIEQQKRSANSELNMFNQISTDPSELSDSQIAKAPGFEDNITAKLNEQSADDPSGLPMDAPAPAGVRSKARKELIKDFRSSYKSYMGRREKLISNLHERMKIMAGGNTPMMNLQPLLNWADSQFGSKLASGYQDPNIAFAAKQAQVGKMQAALMEKTEGMSDDVRENYRLLLNESMSSDNAIRKQQMQNFFNPQITRYVNNFGKGLNLEGRGARNVKKSKAANQQVIRGLSIIELWESGDIVFDDKNAADLSSSVSGLIIGGTPPITLIQMGVYDSFKGNVAKFRQWLSAQPKEFYSDEIIAEIKKQLLRHGEISVNAIADHRVGLYNRYFANVKRLDPAMAKAMEHAYGNWWNVDKKTGFATRPNYTTDEYSNMIKYNTRENPNEPSMEEKRAFVEAQLANQGS